MERVTDWPETGTPTRRQLLAARDLNGNGAMPDGRGPEPQPESQPAEAPARTPRQVEAFRLANEKRHLEAVNRRAAQESPTMAQERSPAAAGLPSPGPVPATVGGNGAGPERAGRTDLLAALTGAGFRLEVVRLSLGGQSWELRQLSQ